ncbi:MAG: TetR/AcrR family transcriptional regulator [Pseudomonadota bacterium]
MSTDTRTSLLNSAEAAARARGFDGFSYADLAEDVGIRKASIHHHFPTKAALSVALMQRYHETLASACAEIAQQHDTAGARLNALVEFYRDALKGGKSLCLCVSFSISRESLSAPVITEIAAFREMLIGWLSAVFTEGETDKSIADVQDPAAEAAAALALIEGAQLAARAQEDVTLFDTSLALLRQRLQT